MKGTVGRVSDRCPWATSAPDYLAYHDEEWGRPVTDDRGLYERLTLEAFQSGLSWLTILRKRPAFRAAFTDFDAETVAAFGDADVARLMADAGIVRNRAKIDAAIANARALTGLHAAGETLTALVWAARPDPEPPAPTGLGDVPPFTDASKALAKDLKRRGFRFLGPTTVYAAMQACGVVNDHVATCVVREAVQAERDALRT
jgi:DNA-3-methyladenine glycosylase I